MGKKADQKADEAMQRIWKEWFEFYSKHFRGPGITISSADQIAFYEIAQPILRDLAR
jgi:hypothetical protein